MKKLTATILIGMGLLMGGCGNNQPNMEAQQTQTQTQTVQQNNGISLGKAIDLAKKGQFTPQKVQFEGMINDKVFGDEPEIIVVTTYNMNGDNKLVHIHITDPEVIKNVAKMQEERKNNFVKGTGHVDANQIIIESWKIEVM